MYGLTKKGIYHHCYYCMSSYYYSDYRYNFSIIIKTNKKSNVNDK